MDSLEQTFVNSPLKRLMQKHFELAIFNHFLKSSHRDIRNGVILDAGCGSGYGLKLLDGAFHPKRLYGIDILPREIQLARLQETKAVILQRDVVDTRFAPASFDVVFIFTVLHHVPQWKEGLREMNRILKPNGLLLVDELNEELVLFFERAVGVKHPKEAQFNWPTFIQGLEESGFVILEKMIFRIGFGLFLCENKGA